MKEENMKDSSSLITSRIIKLLYPFILIFGLYIILNGHMTPGGGFQGGAVLAAVFIAHYMAEPEKKFRTEIFQKIEKVLFVFIILVPLVFLFMQLNFIYSMLNEFYLVIMNILIGIKVSCGLSIIFFRFVLYESR
jgi:multicomponent Na+:H+ antiporter subunit B